MTYKNLAITVAIAAAAAFAFHPSTTYADTWTEVGDAGQTVPTVQGTGSVIGNPLTMIFGSLSPSNDVDLYAINITTPSVFSATTVNALTNASGLDTELYLFNASGAPVYANDDDAGGLTLQSTLPAGNVHGPLAAGTYFLAISTAGNEPVNFANQLLFTADSPSTTIRTPNPSLVAGLSNWDSTFADPGTGLYEIDLTGAFTAVPEPATWFAALLSLGAILVVRRRRFARVSVCVVALVLVSGFTRAFAISPNYNADVPANLGNGLADLVDSHNQLAKAAAAGVSIQTYNGYATEKASNSARLAIADRDTGKVVVDIHLTGAYSVAAMQQLFSTIAPSLEVNAVDATYRNAGMIEGYVDIADVAAIARAGGVASVQLGLKPIHHKRTVNGPITARPRPRGITIAGTFFDNGVTQHRVDQISSIFGSGTLDGSGLSVGCISDSFNGNTTPPTAATNVANFDLPGDPSNPYNTTPVADLQDFTGGTDEGRGMCQIVYHMAPRALLGFATADIGELSFANNIRALAALPGYTFPGQTFAADTICDDVGYFDEPFFQDGVIAQAIDDVSAAGVAYFSSAANDVDVNGYYSVLRVVPWNGSVTAPNPTGGVNSNINLTGVPSNLYAGGFHNFDPSGNPANQNIGQTVNIAANSTNPTTLEWDDPYDFNAGAVLGTQIYSNTGSSTTTIASSCGSFPAGSFVQFDNTSSPPLPDLVAGQGYVLTENATSGNYDAVVNILDPSNNVLVCQDTGVDETVRFVAPVSGSYKFQFGHFASTTGNFTFVLNQATFNQYVVSNWSLLAFRVDTGAYVSTSSLTANTLATNQPIQLGYTNRTSSSISAIQYVFARSNTPSGTQRAATHIRYLIPANGASGYGPAEYFTYGSPTTGGHATASTCNGMAAYSVFRPSIPEAFTSPGPATIFFDKFNNLLPSPVIRLKPNLAAADGANSQWFEVADSTADGDTVGNFSGTSAAGPHAAAIAAMVLQAHGGHLSVTPAQMTSVLQSTTFPHDLDPYTASASIKTSNGGKVTVSVISDNSANAGAISGNVSTTVGTGTNDPNGITVGYAGPGYVKSITFNPNGLATEGGNVTGGNNGLDSTNTYFSNVYPGLEFNTAKAFTVGNLSVGLTSGDVVAVISNQPPIPPSTAGEGWTLGLTFPNNNFTGGKSLRFTIGRSLQHSANVGTYASPTGGPPFAGPASGTSGGVSNPSGDLWGGGVLIPEGTVTTNGMRVSGVMSDNSTFTGFMVNRIGAGYSNVDGYGFINAQAAVSAPLPP